MAVTPFTSTSDLDYGFDKFRAPVSALDVGVAGDREMWGADGFTFGDLIDLVNPLQHIPGVSTFYRELTGDQIDPGARLLGGSVFGGIAGAVSALVNVIVEDATGRDIGENVVALFGGGEKLEDGSAPAPSSLASTETVPSVDQAYQTANLTSTPPAANQVGAASGNELLGTLVQGNVIGADWARNAAAQAPSNTGAASAMSAFSGNGGVAGMQSITRDGSDVAAVLKLYEAYQQRAQLHTQSQSRLDTSE